MVEKPGDNSLSRLKMLYIQAKELSESEVAYVYFISLNYNQSFLFFKNFSMYYYVQCFDSVVSSVGCSDTFWPPWATKKKDGWVYNPYCYFGLELNAIKYQCTFLIDLFIITSFYFHFFHFYFEKSNPIR